MLLYGTIEESFKIQWIPLNVGTLGPALFAHIKRLSIKTKISSKSQKFIVSKKFIFCTCEPYNLKKLYILENTNMILK